MHQPFARTVRLGVPGRPGGDAYVAPHGFFLADGSALVSIDAAQDGPGRTAARPAIEIAVLLEAAYGECRNAPALVKGLEGIARALDAGDLARAAIAAVHLGLPPISDPAAFARLAAADRLLKGGFDPSEPRDSQGRWTTGGGTAAAPPPLATSSHPSPHQSFWDWLNPIGTAQAAEVALPGPVPLPIPPIVLPGTPDNRSFTAATVHGLTALGSLLDPRRVISALGDILFNEEAKTDQEGHAGATQASGADADTAPSVGPGPYAAGSVPTGANPRPSREQQDKINQIGQDTGCHSCGTKDPGTASGNFVGDHQPPTALNPIGMPQVYYPQCLHCSNVQGGRVRQLTR